MVPTDAQIRERINRIKLNYKSLITDQFAIVTRTLGSAHRLELLELLARTTRSVEELAQLSALTVAKTSQRLQQMRRAGLVEGHRDGRRVYQMADPAVVTLLGSLRTVTERNVGAVQKVLNSYFRERNNLEPVAHNELLCRIRKGEVTVSDTRPVEEFDAGRLPAQRLRSASRSQAPGCASCLATGRSAYCRGPYCVLSYEAVSELRKRGSPLSAWKMAIPNGRLRECRLGGASKRVSTRRNPKYHRGATTAAVPQRSNACSAETTSGLQKTSRLRPIPGHPEAFVPLEDAHILCWR